MCCARRRSSAWAARAWSGTSWQTPRSATFGAPYADTIHLFRANLERVFTTRAALVEHIRVTVLHETAHFFGCSEGQLRSMGLA